MAKQSTNWLRVVISLIIIGLIFGWLYESPTAGFVIVVSLALHEAGHLLIFKLFGVDCIVNVIPPIIAYVKPVDLEKYQTLSADKKAVAILAGVSMNLVLYIVGLILINFVPVLSNFGQELVTTNILLISFNILPFSIFDGSKVAWLVMSSIPSRVYREVFYFFVVILAIIGVVGNQVGLPDSNNLVLFVLANLAFILTLGIRQPHIGLPVPAWKTTLIGLAFIGFSLFNLVPFITRMVSLIPSL